MEMRATGLETAKPWGTKMFVVYGYVVASCQI